ncbi:MAG: MBL fold metallo-hydrolase [Promethearchaeota archaeon]
MVQEIITTKTGMVGDYLHLIDVRAFGTTRMLSIYLGEFDDCSILFDCGSSLDIKKLLRYLRKARIPLDSLKYLITSHHHFDHNGGLWKLYNEIKKCNPDVKIIANQDTKELLNNYKSHLERAKRTYGNLTGEMRSIVESAFKIIEPNQKFYSDSKNFSIIDKFHKNGLEIKLATLKTPGHTPDHQTSILINDNQIDFLFLGEALGTIYHTTKLVTMPVSMPAFYDHKEYLNSIENLKNLHPLKVGFGHFGIVNGEKNYRQLLIEHESFMKKFRTLIIKFYEEKPETKYIVNKILPLLTKRTDLPIKHNSVFKDITLGIVYGMLVDLGFRES